MTQEVIHTPTSKNTKIAQALLACGGDVLLVKEKLNKRSDNPITDAEIIEAFLEEASNSTIVYDNIKALLMLNFLQILNECKSQLQVGMAEATLSDITRTIQMVITGIAQLMPQQQAQPQTQVNFLQQFGAEQAKERVIARLETYSKVDEKYGADPNSP